MKQTDELMLNKIMNVIECINLMTTWEDGDGSELFYHSANNSLYISWLGKWMRLLKDGKDLSQREILYYLIGFRENLCLN